jgi:hypothetical protein
MAKKARKPDLRDDMWAKRPGTSIDNSVYDEEIKRDAPRTPGIEKPGFRPQAEGQTTHQ